MNKKYNITESEWKIMQVIWNEPYLTLGEIKKRLDEIVLWDRTTISTLIRRLKKKNILGVEEARFSKYYSLVSEDECLLEEIYSILSRIFYKSPQKLVATLAKHENFNRKEIEQIEKLLNDIKENSK